MFTTLEEKLNPLHTALLIVDMQNDFCHEKGWNATYRGDVKFTQALVPQISELAAKARQAGVKIIFIQAIYDPEYISDPIKERYVRKGWPLTLCRNNSWGADFYGITPQPGDLIVKKHRFSAFAGTELDLLLSSLNIRTTVICGILTNICVESTARDASFLDYYVAVVGDCSAGTDQTHHQISLSNIDRSFGIVCSSEQALKVWG